MDERTSGIMRGVVSGAAATAVFTWTSARLKKHIATHGAVQPIQVASALTGAPQADPGRRQLTNAVLHWGYGGWGGVLRVLLMRRGFTGWRADLTQLGLFWLPWRLLALAHPSAERPSRREENVALYTDLGKHVAYVLTDRLVHALLARRAGRR